MDMSATPANAINHAIWINGEAVDCLLAEDRSIQYGDGFFTTVSIVDEKILNWPAHWARIQQSCQQLQMPLPAAQNLKLWLNSAINAYLREQNCHSAVLKIIVSRGVGGVGYAPLLEPKLNVLFYFKPHPMPSPLPSSMPSFDSNLSIGVCNSPASINGFAGVKSLNRLENVLARKEVIEKGWDEGIMLNPLGHVVCATQSNVYLIKAQQIITPAIVNSGVAGTTRAKLNDLLLAGGWDLQEGNLTLRDIENADELFLTNAVRGVQPITQFAEQSLATDMGHRIKTLWNQWQQEHALSASQLTF